MTAKEAHQSARQLEADRYNVRTAQLAFAEALWMNRLRIYDPAPVASVLKVFTNMPQSRSTSRASSRRSGDLDADSSAPSLMSSRSARSTRDRFVEV